MTIDQFGQRQALRKLLFDNAGTGVTVDQLTALGVDPDVAQRAASASSVVTTLTDAGDLATLIQHEAGEPTFATSTTDGTDDGPTVAEMLDEIGPIT